MTLKKKDAEANENANNDKSQTPDKTAQTNKKTAVAKSVGSVPAVAGASVFIAEPNLVETCEDAEWDTFSSISASSGTHYTNKKDDLGKSLEFQVVLQRPCWKMSANSNDEEAKDYFETSLLGPEDLETAKQEAIDAGYEKAAIKKYFELFIIITNCENADFIGEMFCMNLAPSSVRNWKPLEGKLKVKAAMKKLSTTEVIPEYPAVTFKSIAKPASWDGNNYTVFEFEIV